MSVNTKVNGQLVKSAGLYKTSVPIQSGDIYSFEERQIGVWTDGKPLYQKSIKLDDVTVPQSGRVLIGLGTYISNIDNIIGGEVIVIDGSTNLVLPSFQIATISQYGLTYTINKADGIVISRGSDSGAVTRDFIATVRYTKTTDVAGSGEYVPSGGGADLITTLAEMGITATFVGDYSEMYNDFNHIVRLKDETMNGQGVYFTNNQHFGGVDLPLTLAVRARKGMIQIGYGTGTLPTMISEGTGRTQFRNIPAGGFDTITIPYGSVGFIGKYFVSEDASKECVFEIGI